MGIRHSPRTAYSPWTNGLVEVQNRSLGTHLRMFLHDTPKDWAFQVHMYAYAHNSQPLSELNIINQPSTPNFVQDTIRIWLPFRMFKTVFNKLHEHSHTGMKITYNTFKQYYYIPFLEKWLSIFMHDCIECQRNKHFNIKIQTAPTQSFSEHAPSFNYRISMDTKGPINPPSHNKSYIHVIIDAFSHFVVTVPIKSNNAKTAIKTLLHHWIIKFGPPIYLVTDRGSEYVNKEMAHLLHTYGNSSFS